ncbi:TVP38/TMEM64 family protein [Azospirillum canadense]|uniref:hypothetical protein n=1 Tax=Azospirillum canadense TaxID=403962 RepID=UPI002225E702|nr:hypothetical protein [Azospirillum canadense]MCW2242465.1 hypothetical protein [Azospirillum canadense]
MMRPPLMRDMAVRGLCAAGLIGGIAWAPLSLGHLDPAALEDQLRATGGWAPLVFVLLYTAGTVLFLPGLLFALCAVACLLWRCWRPPPCCRGPFGACEGLTDHLWNRFGLRLETSGHRTPAVPW